jgi:hypothetical protein
MALAPIGFMELHMRQSPMNGANYAATTLRECRQCRGFPWRLSPDRLREDVKRASDEVPDDWSPLLGSVNHVDRILDQRRASRQKLP